MIGLANGFLFSSPLWTLISVALGWADLPGSTVALAIAWTALGLAMTCGAVALRFRSVE